VPTTLLIDSGQARAAIYAPTDVINAPDLKKDTNVQMDTTEAGNLVRLRNSVRDLAKYLSMIGGAEVPIVDHMPEPNDKRVPILIGKFAAERFGEAPKTDTYGQGFRVVVNSQAIGLWGETDLANSYAIYELLHRLGCRWYVPGDMGEIIPVSSDKTLAVPHIDVTSAPYTYYRGVWFADNDFRRRNRLGGLNIAAGHALEGYITKEQRKEHPEWVGYNKGKAKHRRLKWSAPGVTDALADGILERLRTSPNRKSMSLSPDDGLGYDDTDDKKLDAGDWDPTVGDYSITDRQVWMCNRVIEKVTKEHPDMLFGMLAYGQSTRPPVNNKPHPNLIPEFAPITYRRAHPMTFDGVPGNEALRTAIKGWAKLSPKISYYFYGWFLADTHSPSPFITKWSEDLKFIYEHGNCRFWQPETMSNFESAMHALNLGIAMAWDPTIDPEALFAEMHEKYYGEAADEMTKYWYYIDSVWIDCPEYAGAGFGHLNRWREDKMIEARRLMNAALAAAKTPIVKQRIEMNDKSLQLFELFMKLRRDLANGKFEKIAEDAEHYFTWAQELSDEYKDQYAFSGAHYLRNSGKTWNAKYFRAFYKRTYDDAGRIAKEGNILTKEPIRTWQFRIDPDKVGEARGWHEPGFDDIAWRQTDSCVDTLSTLGRHNYLGHMWYRTTVKLDKLPKDKKVYVWAGSVDGALKVFVNGKHVQCLNKKGELVDEHRGYCTAASFDATGVLQPGENQITILGKRDFINELGTPALLGTPVMVYSEK